MTDEPLAKADNVAEEPPPDQLVSESDADYTDDPDLDVSSDGGSQTLMPSGPDVGTWVSALKSAGYLVEQTQFFLKLGIPAGRSHRTVQIRNESLPEAMLCHIESWRSLERHVGIWNRETGEVEVALRDELGTFRHSLFRATPDQSATRQVEPDDAVDLRDEHSGVNLRFGNGSAVASVLLTPRRSGLMFRQARPPLTMRLWPVRVATTEEADDLVQTVSDAVLLQVAMLHGTVLAPLKLEDEQTLRNERRGRRRGPVQFPVSRFPHPPVTLYQAGLDRRIPPLLRYWSLYQVLEYFFPKYSEANRLQAVKQIVLSPTFDPHNDEELLRVIMATETRADRQGEREQLNLCLKGITQKEVVVEVIVDLGLKDALVKKGGPSEKAVHTEDPELLAQLSDRIYDIRCKIVHSKSSGPGDAGPGLLPGTSDDLLVRPELPLLEFLAERALIASSEKFDWRAFRRDDIPTP